MKFAAFLGRVFLVNTAAGIGAAAGVGVVGVAAIAINKKITGKSFTEALVDAVEASEQKKAEEAK